MDTKQVFFGGIFSMILLTSLAGCDSPKTKSEPGITEQPATLALVNGIIIDGTGADPVPEGVILIAGDRILAIGSQNTLAVPDGIRSIDLEGSSILPGFINAHVHGGFNKDNLQAWAYGGVTTIRDEGTTTERIAQLKAFRSEVGRDPRYARIISAGTMITVPGGYGDLFVSSPEQARQKVIEELNAGVNLIKVSLEDGYAGTHGLPKLTPEELRAIVEAAHEHGTLVSGHITQAAYLQSMIDAGVDDIAHLPYDYIPPESLQKMVEKGIYLTPTFTVLRNYGATAATLVENLNQFIGLGGKVALGNDYGGGPGTFELGIPLYEIQMMSQAGMTSMQIIIACTKNAAHISQIGNEVGTLEPGKFADILIVSGNPLEDWQVLTDVKMVIHAGVIIRDEIQK